MKATKIYLLYDARYLTVEDSATLYEIYNSKREVEKNSHDYGSDTVIVEADIVGKQILNEKIIKPSAE